MKRHLETKILNLRFQTGCILVIFTLFVMSGIASAEPKIFSGVSTAVITDKTCDATPSKVEVTFVFDEEVENAQSGWFYGRGTSAAELHRISPLKYDVIYPITRLHKLPPSQLELQYVKGSFRAVIKDHIPEDGELREETCYYKRMEFDLSPTRQTSTKSTERAKEVYSAELLLQEGTDLVFNEKEYDKAKIKGLAALAIFERIYGKFTDETLDSSLLIANALMWQDRFDEALAVVSPYSKSILDKENLNAILEIMQKLKKQQDDQFRYDPDSTDEVDLDPLG